MDEMCSSVFKVTVWACMWEEKLNGIKGGPIGDCSRNCGGRKKPDGHCSRATVLELDVPKLKRRPTKLRPWQCRNRLKVDG